MKKSNPISVYNEELLSSLDIQGWNLKSFGEELYENTGQLISLAKIQLATINLEKKEETRDIIDNSGRILNRVIKNLRSLARQLTPSDILERGFLPSLKYELDRMNQLDFWKIDLRITGKPVRAEVTRELILFSIIQHYILDALYNEKARQIDITVDFVADMMKISLFYQLNPDLLMVKKGRTGMGVLRKAAHIGAVISRKGKKNRREISICLKK